jgi:DNA mismatch repair protein MutS
MAKTVTAPSVEKSSLTPMMQQFIDVKERYPDCLLFYRMGDFYELFFEDAVIAAETLDITLTKRGKNQGQDIPMCGVPFHAYESYLAKLIKAGFKVAICEQTETPEEAKKRDGSKALVKRDVVRVVTQGTLTEDTLLHAKQNNYLCTFIVGPMQAALAWCDLSTGHLATQAVDKNALSAHLIRLNPSEIIASDKDKEFCFQLDQAMQSRIHFEPSTRFNYKSAENSLKNLYAVQTLDSFGTFKKEEIMAAGTLIDYVERTQLGQMPYIAPIKQHGEDSFLHIDAATRRSLELTHTQQGEIKGSLLHTIDHCQSGAGSRLLSQWLSSPLTNKNNIEQRLNKVSSFLKLSNVRADIRNHLKATPDLERAMGRLTIGRGSPRDLDAIRNALDKSLSLKSILEDKSTKSHDFTQEINTLTHNPQLSKLKQTLEEAITEDPPALTRDGGFIAKGFDTQLDRYKTIKEDSRKLIAELQGKYVSDTGINTLRISFNNMLGYFIEVSSKHGDKLLIGANSNEKQEDKGSDSNPYIHRQTLANSMRFTTPELSQLERDIMEATTKALAVEQAIFDRLVKDVTDNAPILHDIAEAIATLDVYTALAALAEDENYTQPTITEDICFDVKGGRHAVVEQALRQNNTGAFVSNECHLNEDDKIWLLTGPNMAGKSTFLRQNALIAILAQIGSFVPADSATIGIIDKLFSRVGAADDLASGRSTFMVEMVETATILNQATERSFVILDEIGRGTATYDGLSIAWACLEHLNSINQCRTLFATHYHELTSLEESLPALSCHSMQVKEWQGDIVFLHQVGKGAANRSYGIHVGKLAGLPKPVLKRAESILALLEKEKKTDQLDALPLFEVTTVPTQEETTQGLSKINDLLANLDPNELSPREALDIIYELKNAIG